MLTGVAVYTPDKGLEQRQQRIFVEDVEEVGVRITGKACGKYLKPWWNHLVEPRLGPAKKLIKRGAKG